MGRHFDAPCSTGETLARKAFVVRTTSISQRRLPGRHGACERGPRPAPAGTLCSLVAPDVPTSQRNPQRLGERGGPAGGGPARRVGRSPAPQGARRRSLPAPTCSDGLRESAPGSPPPRRPRVTGSAAGQSQPPARPQVTFKPSSVSEEPGVKVPRLPRPRSHPSRRRAPLCGSRLLAVGCPLQMLRLSGLRNGGEAAGGPSSGGSPSGKPPGLGSPAPPARLLCWLSINF